MATIQLTDGTTTLNLYDTDSYNLIDESWSPAVATRRQDALGGLPYTDVTETLALRIKGTSTANCLDKLHNLTVLLDQADRWRMGEDVDAVLFKYKPSGSTANVLSAAVLGTPGSGQAVSVPGRVEWIEDNNYQLFPVIVSFVRRGAWLDDEESDASSSTANPGIMTATNTATDLPSPVKLSMTNFTSTQWGGSFLLVTDDADKLDIFSVSGLTATGFTTVAEATKNPYSGSVLRYTPPDTDWNYSAETDIKTLLLSDSRKIAIYFNARRNAAGTTAQVKIKVRPVTGGYNTLAAVETQPIQLDYPDAGSYSDISPQYYFAGLLHLPIDISAATNMYLSIGVQTNNTSSTVDFDAMCLMDVRNQQSQVLYFPASDASGLFLPLEIDHRLLTFVSPRARINGTTIKMDIPTMGARSIDAQTAEVSAMWLATGRAKTPAASHWKAVSNVGVPLSNVLTAVRRPAYLVPQ